MYIYIQHIYIERERDFSPGRAGLQPLASSFPRLTLTATRSLALTPREKRVNSC